MAEVNRSAVYSCTALVGSNKTGKLTPDADGYYTLVVGGLDVYNSAGAFYPLNTGKKIFEESSSLMRRVRDGACKGETGHPKPLPGQTQREFIQRVMIIEETKVCAHFKSFWLEERMINGQTIIAIVAEVKPAGVNGPALKEALENRHENVAFSIRSLTQDYNTPTGMLVKNLKTVITFDWVTEPGISAAKKWNAPALESLEDHVVLPEYLTAIDNVAKLSGVSMEHSLLDTDSIREDLGWQELPRNDGRNAAPAVPRSASW